MNLVLTDEVPDGGVGDHDLHGHAAALARGLGDEGLAHDPFQHQGELGPHLGLLVAGEPVDDAVDGLHAGVGVQGAKGEVARLRDGEGGFDGLQVAHFTHQHHVGILAKGRPEGLLEAVGVRVDLPLVHQALLVLVDVFDGVLDGQDVQGL